MDTAIQRHIEDPLAEGVLRGDFDVHSVCSAIERHGQLAELAMRDGNGCGLGKIGLSRGRAAGQTRAAMQALARVDLAHHAGRPYQSLSGGEQQRAQLARVLAQVGAARDADGPRWLLLDEPVSALDIAHQLEVMQIARDFADAGGGVVAVMHDLNLTAMFADRIVLLAEGHVLSAGTVAEVRVKPGDAVAVGDVLLTIGG